MGTHVTQTQGHLEIICGHWPQMVKICTIGHCIHIQCTLMDFHGTWTKEYWGRGITIYMWCQLLLWHSDWLGCSAGTYFTHSVIQSLPVWLYSNLFFVSVFKNKNQLNKYQLIKYTAIFLQTSSYHHCMGNPSYQYHSAGPKQGVDVTPVSPYRNASIQQSMCGKHGIAVMCTVQFPHITLDAKNKRIWEIMVQILFS